MLGYQRRRTANKLKNPRIAMITYHSCRHWKATRLYHQTKDILYVMKFLGHRSIKNTLMYIDLERICYPGGDDYTGKAARTEAEALQLVEAGFEYVCQWKRLNCSENGNSRKVSPHGKKHGQSLTICACGTPSMLSTASGCT